MKTIEHLKRSTGPFEAGLALPEAGHALRVAGVYQDFVTRHWAMRGWRRAAQLAGEESIQSAWYNASALSEPGFLLDAVRAALVADVIVVSVYAADELPTDLYVWFDAWLPRRHSRVGALTALVGVAESLKFEADRTLEYLQAVARKARLDFIPQPRARPIASPVASN